MRVRQSKVETRLINWKYKGRKGVGKRNHRTRRARDKKIKSI